jgi:hypothetical protein
MPRRRSVDDRASRRCAASLPRHRIARWTRRRAAEEPAAPAAPPVASKRRRAASSTRRAAISASLQGFLCKKN